MDLVQLRTLSVLIDPPASHIPVRPSARDLHLPLPSVPKMLWSYPLQQPSTRDTNCYRMFSCLLAYAWLHSFFHYTCTHLHISYVYLVPMWLAFANLWGEWATMERSSSCLLGHGRVSHALSKRCKTGERSGGGICCTDCGTFTMLVCPVRMGRAGWNQIENQESKETSKSATAPTN